VQCLLHSFVIYIYQPTFVIIIKKIYGISVRTRDAKLRTAETYQCATTSFQTFMKICSIYLDFRVQIKKIQIISVFFARLDHLPMVVGKTGYWSVTRFTDGNQIP
jgi:hypothetical protein